MSFYDDITHTKPVVVGVLAHHARLAGFKIISSGTSRNWIFALSHPFFLFAPPSRQKYTARLHWLGWSSYLIVERPTAA
jgi:hypothetical protein